MAVTGQGAPSQHGRIQPHPSQRSWEVSQRIKVPQLGQGSVRSAMRGTVPAPCAVPGISPLESVGVLVPRSVRQGGCIEGTDSGAAVTDPPRGVSVGGC